MCKSPDLAYLAIVFNNQEAAAMRADPYNIIIEIATNEDISKVSFIRKLLDQWKSFNSAFLPDRWGYGEFCRKPLDIKEGYSDLCAVWSDSHLPPTIARKSKLPAMYNFYWLSRTADKSIQREDVFKYSMTAQLDKKTTYDELDALCKLFIDNFLPGYIGITTLRDFSTRHTCSVNEIMPNGSTVTFSKFSGSRVGKYLPGLYWRTYLSDELGERFGLSSVLHDLDLHEIGYKINSRNGYLVMESLASLVEFSEDNWKIAQSFIEHSFEKRIFFDAHIEQNG